MAGERVLQATAVIDLEDLASGKIAKLAQKLASLERLTKMMGKADGFASFDRQAQGIEKAATAIGHLERQVANLTRLDRVAGDINRMSQAVERLDRASSKGAASNRRLAESLPVRDRIGQNLALAGPAILAGTRHAWAAGAELKHTEVQMRQAGMSADEIERARHLAGTLARQLPTMSVAELMEMHKETRSSVQHAEEAFHLMSELARAKAALKGMGVENAHLADIVKGGESLGLMSDPARFSRYLEGQVKAMAVMGRTITTEQVYEAAKYSKSAGATLSDDFLNLVLPSLIQEMHGSSAGDALSMLVKTLRGGMQNRHVPVEKLAELGLLEDKDAIVRTKTGSIKGYKGKVVGDDLLASSPDRWFSEVFKPAAEKAGYKSLSDQVRLLSMVLPQTAANLGRILLQQEETLKAHRRLYEGAPSLEQMNANLRDDPKAQLAALGHAIENFAGVLSSPMMVDAARMMDGFARKLGVWQEKVAEFQAKHPDLARAGSHLAMIGGATAGAVGTYGLLDGLINGFGLKGSARALDGSAAALTRAAGVLGAGGGLPGGGPGGSPKFGMPWIRTLLGAVLMADLVGDIPEPGTKEWDEFHKRVEERNKQLEAWLRDHTPDWMKPIYGPNPYGDDPKPEPATGYVTDGGFGGGFGVDGRGSPAGERAAQLREILEARGGLAPPPGISVHDFTLADQIRPPAGSETIPLPVPRPSDAAMAGFDDSLREAGQSFASTLNSAFSGQLSVSFEVKPSPMFDAYVSNIAKTAAERVTAAGSIGSSGANGVGVDQHQ